MEDLGSYVIASIVVGFTLGFWVARSIGRYSNKHNVRVLSLSTIDANHHPQLAKNSVMVSVAVPREAAKHVRIHDSITAVLR